MEKLFFCALLLMNLFIGCNRAAGQQEPIYRKISSQEAYKMMSENENFILLDVRTIAEYREKRIPGAVLIPDYELVNRSEKELPYKDQLIFVYCRSGNRSAASTRTLVNMGYTNVYDFGGISSWYYNTESD